MSLGKINYLNTGDPNYDRGFADGIKANIMAGNQRVLAVDEGYNLINRIRKLSKDDNLSHFQREQRLIQIFNATQEFLLSKGLI